jgi:TolB protein
MLDAVNARAMACAWAVVVTGLAGCGEPTSTDAGALAITTATSGPSPDPDGYMVRVDGKTLRRARIQDTVVVLLAESETHSVMLAEVSSNCAVSGDSVRSVPVPRGDTTWVQFELTCGSTAGALRITTVSTGTELDPNGYELSIAGIDQPITLPPNGVYATAMASGRYALTLAGNTANCEVADGTDREVDILAGATSDVTFTAACSAAAPAGPGHEIAFTTTRSPEDGQAPNRVYLMNDDGTGLRAKPGVARDFLFGLTWLPEGTTLALMATPKDDDIILAFLLRMDIESGSIDTLFTVHGFDRPEWSPDGSQIAYVDNLDVVGEGNDEVWVAAADGGDRRQVTSDDIQHWAPTWSPDGTRLAYAAPGGGPAGLGDRIIVLTISDSVETPILTDFPGDIFQLDWSPDGATIAFAGAPDFNTSHIFTVPATGSSATQLTSGQASDFTPNWSPDGRRIAFVSNRDGNGEIYVMNADGSNQLRLTNDPASDTNPAWR